MNEIKIEASEELLTRPVEASKLTGVALVNYVNKRQPFFEAEYSPKAEQRLKHLMKTEFVRNAPKAFNVERNEEPITNVDIPER
ncbi:unnamed protein product [Haemonchus placei]|uniref:PRTRC system protein C n=1 Tax=Haemonchus placei TaxID=6290 RepID=A0A0N4VZN9_HAEPC|nr:unnamed protein product [Haemonchus placei]